MNSDQPKKERITYGAGDVFRVKTDHAHNGVIMWADFCCEHQEPCECRAIVAFDCERCLGHHGGTHGTSAATLERVR